MGEYQIVDGKVKDCQKILNQWKHEYDLEILEMCQSGGDWGVSILLIRTRKE